MGVHRSPAIADYWKHDDQNPLHPIRTHMSQTRFEQIKRYLHIESPSVQKEQKDPSTGKVTRFWHSKVDPILEQLRESSQRYRTPSTNCNEPSGAFPGRQHAGLHEPVHVSSSCPQRPDPCAGICPRLGPHLGLGIRPRWLYLPALVPRKQVVPPRAPRFPITDDHSLSGITLGRASPKLPSVTPMRPRASSPPRKTLDVIAVPRF
jgi:hypothetical protein